MRIVHVVIWLTFTVVTVSANEEAKRLFDDLMKDYNKLLRPVQKPLEKLRISMKLRLSQIIKVHEKDQIMTTSVWLRQEWMDNKLVWNPSDYGGVSVLYIPAEMIWVPDLVLYNNADSNYNITIPTKATIRHNGSVLWDPPAIFKSMCEINVEWFPFDDQSCFLKFGSWTYAESLLDLQHASGNVEYTVEANERGEMENVSIVRRGIDISDYYPSVEWDILEMPARRHNRFYMSCCPDTGSYVDITYYIKLRRKPLFYTVNLIFPCVGISFLTILVFYLPSASGEKITLCISILVSLTVFFLLLTEIIPATSLVLPLIGKYLLFTMCLVTLSVVVTVIALNLHFRTPTTHTMPSWVKSVFLHYLPKYLRMRRPLPRGGDSFRFPMGLNTVNNVGVNHTVSTNLDTLQNCSLYDLSDGPIKSLSSYNVQSTTKRAGKHSQLTDEQKKRLQAFYNHPDVLKAFDNVRFIAELLKKQDRHDRVDEDWKYVAMVLDRLFLWIFTFSCFFGTIFILLQAPSFYETTSPLKSEPYY